MRVWLITVGEPLPLPGRQPRLLRTGLLANALVEHGHQVVWWTSHVDHYAKAFFPGDAQPVSLANGVEVRFLRGMLYRRNVSLARLVNHRQIARDFRRNCAAITRPDVILCSLPTIELALEAARWGRANGIPVLIDIRDLWPDVLADALPRTLATLGRAVLWPLYRELRQALSTATGVVAISETFLGWALRHAGRGRSPNDAVYPIAYPELLVPPESLAAAAERHRELDPERTGRRIIWFVGAFNRWIDLETPIEAARRLHEQGRDDFLFVLSGHGDHALRWRNLAAGLPNVLFTGWIAQADIAYIRGIAWAGLAPYRTGVGAAMGNKLFEFMAGGLPILYSHEGEPRDIMSGTGAGLYFQAGDHEALTAAIHRLADEPGLRDTMSVRATETYRARFRADVVYGAMVAHLSRVESGR